MNPEPGRRVQRDAPPGFLFARERQRGSDMRSRWTGLLLAALTLAGGVIPVRAETLEERVERMERELSELKAEIKRRNATQPGRKAGRTERRASSEPPAQPRTATAPEP